MWKMQIDEKSSASVTSTRVTFWKMFFLFVFLFAQQETLAWSLQSPQHSDILLSLIQSVGWNPTNVHVKHLDQEKSAFCNTVYQLTVTLDHEKDTNVIAIAKLFSPIALGRMVHLPVGTMDSYVASKGLAPKILAKTKESILMEFCENSCISDNNQHGEKEYLFDYLCASSLAKLHSLPSLQSSSSSSSLLKVKSNENMLWRSCRVSLLYVHDQWMCPSQTGISTWTKDRLDKEIQKQQVQLSQKSLLMEVPIAHGDCKPSNVIHQEEQVLFIDLELCGRNYRAFDLAKFLRDDHDPALQSSSKRRTQFLSTYAEQVGTTIQQLQLEIDEILPMTWLEAAIFFAAMASINPENSKRWNFLAATRLQNYELCCNVSK